MPDGYSPAVMFARGVSDGLLRYQRCGDCDRAVFYPRVLCPFCGSQSLRWCDSSGQGVIYAHTWVNSRDGGYSVALVDLDEGFRMMSSVVGVGPELIPTGMRVSSHVDRAGDGPRVVFSLDGVRT